MLTLRGNVLITRVGVSDVSPQKYLFHDSCDVIITSRMAISDLVNNDNNNVLPLAVPLVKWTPLVVVRNDFSDVLSHKKRVLLLDHCSTSKPPRLDSIVYFLVMLEVVQIEHKR